MRKFGICGEQEQLDGIGQEQHRRRRQQQIAGKRKQDAGRSVRAWVPIVIVMVRRLLRGFGRENAVDGRKIDIAEPDLHGRPSMRRVEVEMPERQRKLDRERKQRQPRAGLDMSTEPLHAKPRPTGRLSFPAGPDVTL